MKVILKGTSGMIMVAIVLGMLIFGALGASTAYMASIHQASSNEDSSVVSSAYIADAGMQYTLIDILNQLNDTSYNRDFSSLVVPGTLNLGGGTFTVSFVPSTGTPTSRMLESVSTIGNGKRIVRQTVSQTTVFPDVAVARRDLNLFHTAGNISNSSGSLVWYGNQYSSGTVSFSGSTPVLNTTTPLAIPRIDPQSSTSFPTYAAIAQSAGQTYTCSTPCYINSSGSGPRYYQGTLIIQPTTSSLTYSGVLYATGNIILMNSTSGSFSPNVTTLVSEVDIWTPNAGANPLRSQIIAGTHNGQQMPALVARRDIRLPETANATITGLVWAGRDINLRSSSASLNLRGGLISHRDLLMDGITSLSFAYDPVYLTSIPGLLGGRYLVTSNWQQ